MTVSDSQNESGGVPQDDVDEFIEYVEEVSGDDKLATYFEMMVEDYEDGQFTESGRYFEFNGEDISSIIDLSVIFGTVWERDDPEEVKNGE